ncbi:hypothetical protein AAE478_007108 [Parahypoxylon ruwenzoriense]
MVVELENLRTASLYINNQLLSRGLLRDGHDIDFADPESGEGGLQATMGKVMSVINDLILRRDRDAENRESLSTTLRTLRADSQRQTSELSRQAEKLADTQRRLDGAEATERALRTQLKAAEQNTHKLKEDAARMKSLTAQARAACANEIRKRDRQIDGLKKAVADATRVRGGGKNPHVLCISVAGLGEVGADEVGGMPAGATQAEGYSLRLETNAFLTELARGLSEENEGLLAILKRAVDGLRDMSGLDRNADSTNGANHRADGNNADSLVMVPPQKSAEELAAELEAIMEHLRTILTNPSFVPIEEVEVREEAINRLRAGLETMESRWKDAVHMIDGWRKRMVSGGRSVDMEDLRMSLRLSPVRVRDVEETADVIPIPMKLSYIQEEEEEEDGRGEEEDVETHARGEDEPQKQKQRSPSPAESLHLVPAPGYGVEAEENADDSDSDSSSIFQDDDIDMEELDAEEPNVQVLQESTMTSVDSPPLPVPPQLSPLKDSYSSGNRGSSREQEYHKRAGDFTTIVEENTWDLAATRAEEEKRPPTPPPHVIKPQLSPKQQQQRKSTTTATSKRSPPWQEQTRPNSNASYDSPLFGRSGERPSQSSQKLFSKATSSIGKQAQVKAQTPEPETVRTPTTRTPTSRSRRPTTSSARASPDPVVVEIKRTNSDPVNTPSRVQHSSASRSQGAASQSQPVSSVSSSSKQLINVVTANATQQQQQQQSLPSRPRSSMRPNQTTTATATTAATITTVTSSGSGTTTTTTNSTSSSRLPRPNTSSGGSNSSNNNNTTTTATTTTSALPHPQQSPLTIATIAAKLAASEREADAARVRAKLRAVRSNNNGRRLALAPAPIITSAAPATKIPSAPASPAVKGALDDEDLALSVDPVKRDMIQQQQQLQLQQSPRRRSRRKTGEDVGLLIGGSASASARARRRDANGAADGNESPDELAGSTAGEQRQRQRQGQRKSNGGGNIAGAGVDGSGVTRRKRDRGERRTSKVASRRRSTLSPWELETLIQGNAGAVGNIG